MLAPNHDPASDDHERARAEHRARVGESQPLLDKSIPLGFPPLPANDCRAVENYYRTKHRRGDFGTYWPLHRVTTFAGSTRAFRRGH